MKDPKDPVQQLTDTLTLLRVEIAEVKNCQITEKQLKHLHLALEKTALKVESVAQSAGEVAERGVGRLSHEMGQTSRNMQEATNRATQGLSDAIRVIRANFLSKKRTIYLLLLFSTLFGLMLGALGGSWIGDYKMATELGQSIQGPEAAWYCEQAGGQIYVPESGSFCGILIFK